MKPGLYINLDEFDYFQADALGSSDLKKLLRATPDWWYSSRHNVFFEEADDTQARILGRALHALLLEGSQAFDGRFAIEPDPRDYPGALKTTAEIREFIEGMSGEKIPGISKMTKADLVKYAVDAGYGGRVWDHITAAHTQDVFQFQKTPIKANQARALKHMAQLVEDEPTLGPALQQGLCEVSVFWHREGEEDILYRARLDSVSPHFTLDLKTLSNWKNRSIADMARRQIEEFEYDIQRRFYDEGRQMMRKFIREGDVYCPDGEVLEPRTKKVLQAIAETDHWQWVWLFYQVRDDKAGKAPVMVPRFHRPEGQVWEQAGLKIEKAIENYRDFMKRFGPDTPWCHIEPVLELEDQDLANLQYKGV